MHHRRGSSLAVISGTDRPGGISGATSSAIAKPSRTLASLSPSLFPVSQRPPMIRRRLGRPLAFLALLAFPAFVVLILLSAHFDGGSLASRDSRHEKYVENVDRPYPPSMAPGRSLPIKAKANSLPLRPAAKPLKLKGNGDATPGGARDNDGGSALKLTLAEELGAVVAYVTSLGAHANIPTSIDPARPIDAELILGFNTRSPRASTEVAELVRETWQINPVVLFGDVRPLWSPFLFIQRN